ncbi:MAG: hypothetical protein QME40_00350 [bacterium]|nr:hypothetical protein [bacterium]
MEWLYLVLVMSIIIFTIYEWIVIYRWWEKTGERRNIRGLIEKGIIFALMLILLSGITTWTVKETLTSIREIEEFMRWVYLLVIVLITIFTVYEWCIILQWYRKTKEKRNLRGLVKKGVMLIILILLMVKIANWAFTIPPF